MTHKKGGVSAKNGTVKVISDGDLTVRGADGTAKHIDTSEVAGDTIVESVQDKESHESGHLSYSIGSQVGFSYGYDKAQKAWVGEQSKIIGTESVNMAGKTLTNKGAVIAQINDDGTDGGNMDMNFDKIEVSDIKDKDERDAMSAGVHVSVGGSYGTDSGLRGPDPSQGSTDIAFSNGGHDKRRTTGGRIGNGRIIENGKETELVGVNRDINNTQTITRDETHGGVDIHLNIDNHMITNPGDYVQAVKDTPKNLKRAGWHVGNITHAHYLDATRQVQGNEIVRGTYMNNSEVDSYVDTNGEYAVGAHTREDAAMRERREARTVVHSRSIALDEPFNDLGRHLFIEIDPSNYDSNAQSRYISLDGKPFGGVPEVSTVAGFPNDRASIDNGDIRESQEITVPDGMTEQEFDQLVISNAESYDLSLETNHYPTFGTVHPNPLRLEPRNSNTFIDDVIEESGGNINDFDKAFLQNNGEKYQETMRNYYERRGWDQERIDESTRRQRGFRSSEQQ